MVPPLVIIFLLIVFRPWVSLSGTLSAGDWPYLYLEQIKEFSLVPQASFLWLAPYYQVLAKLTVQYLGLSWHLVERLFWFWPWIVVSFLSARKLTKSWVGGLIYTTNTYALMLVGGGQMGVALAYALAPLVLEQFSNSIGESYLSRDIKYQKSNIKKVIQNGLLLAVQAMFDPRIALLTLVAAAGYWLIVARKKLSLALTWFGIPLIIALFLHTYWWVPLLKNPTILSTQFAEATSGAVKYLSFATFSNSLSLLHPNWPENIFGKVYFQRPEFLLIPMVAFSSLLLKPNGFWALLALVGAFLAKGANPPFGGIYLWLFENIPGFSLFRDATKFYLYVALAYAVLIPYLLAKLNKKFFVILFLVFWGFTIGEAIMGRLGGTFKPIEVPQEYLKLKDEAVSWYPKKSRFSLSGNDYQTLEGIRYIVVPTDVRGEVFVTDRRYDEVKRQEAIMFIATMSGVKRVSEFKDLVVFEVMR